MKIVDLKCPSCGGRLIPVEGNAKIVCCEYCKSQFVLEDDQVINYHIHQYSSPVPAEEPGRFAADTGQMQKPMAAAVALLVFAAVSIFAAAFMHSKPKDEAPSVPYSMPAAGYGEYGEDPEEETEEREHSPLYTAMVETIFQKPESSVTEQDLEKVKYLSVQTGQDGNVVEYSLDDPYGAEPVSCQSFPTDPLDWDVRDLGAFLGLVKADVGNGWTDLSMFGEMKELKGLSCYGASFSQLAESLPASQIIELSVEHPDGLEGIGAFENLEILTLNRVEAPDFKELVPLKNLKSLTVEESGVDPDSDTLTDYGALSVLTGLEHLSLDSEAVREFSFLKHLTNLESLSIEGTEAIGVEPLGELTGLKSLALVGNNSVLDYSPIGNLTGLTSLVLDKSTSGDDPDLSSLGNLNELEISGFISVSFLRNMGNLKSLSIHGCNIDEIQALSALTGLESLACYSVWTYAVPLRGLSFIDGMGSLKRLWFCNPNPDGFFSGYGNNVEIYGDISNVLNHQGLEELYLNDCVFGISFDRLVDNPSLKVLQMNGVSLKENFYVQSSGGMTDIWYDDVSFDENTGFLAHYPNLEELELDENQLTNIQFVSSLGQLAKLSIRDNYVTDLTPLNREEKLKYLDIRKNPVSNAPEASDGMVLLK